MNDQLQQKLGEILDYLLQTTKAGVDFASQQLPLIAWEQVAFARAWHTAWVVMPVVAALVGWRYVHGWWSRLGGQEDADEKGVCFVVGAIGGGICGITAGVNLYWALMVWLAPRVYLLNWAVDLVRQARAAK